MILAVVSHKAKRISSSTSTAETLSAVVGKELAQLVAVRLSELLGHGLTHPFGTCPTLSSLRAMQEDGAWIIPIDHVTDCKDVFELVTGPKGILQRPICSEA